MAFSVDQTMRKAQKHARRGELENAARLYREVLERYPGNMRASQALAALQGQPAAAPRAGPSASGASTARAEIGKLVGLFNQGRFELVATTGAALAKRFPNEAIIHNVLGAARSQLGLHDRAAESFAAAARLEPGNPDIQNNLGIALNETGRSREAAACFERALAIKPQFAVARANLGNALDDLGRHEAAVESYRKALELQPGVVQLYNNLGIALQQLGRFDEARESFANALALKPDYAEVHVNLSAITKYQPGDAQMAAVETLLKDGRVSEQDRERYHFVLGKAYDDLGEYEQAFAHFEQGNRLRKALLGYHIDRDRKLFADIKQRFTADGTLPELGRGGEAFPTGPVFILGMPRSGTSLVEQILASHSRVSAGGELDLLTTIVGELDWPDAQIGAQGPGRIRRDYLRGIEAIEVDGPLVTDKMPLNFQWAGLIAKALPEAPIVHTRRDARAVCWSLFRTRFSATGQRFAYDLTDAAEFYLLYQDLMRFWHEQMPGRIYDLDYERLTENQESETRRLVDHIGLEWEDACLDFHRTNTASRTASLAQVRRKMYRGSSEQWRNYERFLGPMLETLERRSVDQPRQEQR